MIYIDTTICKMQSLKSNEKLKLNSHRKVISWVFIEFLEIIIASIRNIFL